MRNTRINDENNREQHNEDEAHHEEEAHHEAEAHHEEQPQNQLVHPKTSYFRNNKYRVDVQGQ